MGGPPGPRGSPWTRTSTINRYRQHADEGVGRGPRGSAPLVSSHRVNAHGLTAPLLIYLE